MSNKDWLQLQAYKATGLTPEETGRAVCTLAGYLEGAICYEQIRDGAGCPGRENCPLGSALLAAKAAKPADAIIAGKRTTTLCEDMALCYPDTVLRYFWNTEAKKDAVN